MESLKKVMRMANGKSKVRWEFSGKKQKINFLEEIAKRSK